MKHERKELRRDRPALPDMQRVIQSCRLRRSDTRLTARVRGFVTLRTDHLFHVSLALLALLVGCENGLGGGGDSHEDRLREQIVGAWYTSAGEELVIRSDGTFYQDAIAGTFSGTWSYDPPILKLTAEVGTYQRTIRWSGTNSFCIVNSSNDPVCAFSPWHRS